MQSNQKVLSAKKLILISQTIWVEGVLKWEPSDLYWLLKLKQILKGSLWLLIICAFVFSKKVVCTFYYIFYCSGMMGWRQISIIPHTVKHLKPPLCHTVTWPSGKGGKTQHWHFQFILNVSNNCWQASFSFSRCCFTIDHHKCLRDSRSALTNPSARWHRLGIQHPFLSFFRIQQPATTSTITTQTLSPDTTPLMRTSELSAREWHSVAEARLL